MGRAGRRHKPGTGARGQLTLTRLYRWVRAWLTRTAPTLLQGRMWEETLKDMQLPQASFSKLSFTDGISKVRGASM
jgi:hypothetical protein